MGKKFGLHEWDQGDIGFFLNKEKVAFPEVTYRGC